MKKEKSNFTDFRKPNYETESKFSMTTYLFIFRWIAIETHQIQLSLDAVFAIQLNSSISEK